MKLPNLELFPLELDSTTKIGIEWLLCREAPIFYYPKADKVYYEYLVINFNLLYWGFHIDLYYKKMPYKNFEEYKLYRKYNASTNS